MNTITTHTGYTIDDLAAITGRAKSTIVRKRGLDQFLLGIAPNPAGRGPYLKIFRKDAVHLWLPNYKQQQIEEIRMPRKKRNDRGFSRKLPGEIEVRLIANTFQKYMSQAQVANIRESALQATLEYCTINGAVDNFNTPHELAEFVYQKRIMRKDQYFVGYAHRGNWKLRHKRRYQKKQFNNLMPTNRWDYIALFTDAGLLRKGMGAAKMWVIDGSQFDAWVDINGKKTLFSYLQIFDGITGYPLLVQPIESESINAVSMAFAKCYEMFGVPEYGIVLDNSKTFRSAHIRSFLHNLFSDEALAGLNQRGSWFRKIFPGQEAPLIYNLPNIPKFPLKAAIERSFRQHKDKHVATAHALAYQGADRKEAVRLSLNNTASLSQKFAPKMQEAWDNFINWLYNDYVNRVQTSSLATFKKLTGKLPTIANAFEYYGAGTNKVEFPEANKPQLFYYLSPKEFRHSVKARLGSAIVTHKNQSYNYHCTELTQEFYGRKIAVVPDWRNPDTAYVYLEYDKKWQDDRTPEPGSVFFIGTAHNALINSLETAGEYIYRRRENQRIQEQSFEEQTDPVYSPWTNNPPSSQEGDRGCLSDNQEKLLYKNRAISMDSAENTQGTDDDEVQGLSPRHDPVIPTSPGGEGSENYDDDYIDHEVVELLDESIF